MQRPACVRLRVAANTLHDPLRCAKQDPERSVPLSFCRNLHRSSTMRYSWLCALTVRQIESAKERSKSRKHRVRSRLVLEALEQRCLLSAYGTIIGFGNNIADPPSGEAGVDLLRVSQYSYANGIGPPSQPMARIEAIAGGEMGACFFSDGSCEQMTEGTCEAVGGISWRAGEP